LLPAKAPASLLLLPERPGSRELLSASSIQKAAVGHAGKPAFLPYWEAGHGLYEDTFA